MFVVIVLVSALANWLSKRNETKNSGDQPQSGSSTATPPTEPADWEERLRRLLGEQLAVPPTPRPAQGNNPPAPPLRRPPVPPVATRPPIIRQVERRPATPPRPPTIEAAPSVPGAAADGLGSDGVAGTVRRFEQLDPAVMTPVRPIGMKANRSASGLSVALRTPQAVRQAFVASLVFGPPKAMED